MAFDYRFRPAKHIERLMIVDLCRRLSAIAPTERYRYVGFGALEFIDFELFHRALGISRMVSIEDDITWPRRYEFNKPFKGVEVLSGRAKEHLPNLDWRGLRIVWLDYEGVLCEEFVRDAELVVRSLEQGSILIVTLAAGARVNEKLATLQQSLGHDRLPLMLTEESMEGRWGFAAGERSILTSALEAVAAARADGASLQQLLNICYADGGKMQTLAWIVSSDALDQTVESCRFGQLDFVRREAQVLELKVPVLTKRELNYLNQRLPASRKIAQRWLDPALVEQYRQVYRYYPTFVAGSA